MCTSDEFFGGSWTFPLLEKPRAQLNTFSQASPGPGLSWLMTKLASFMAPWIPHPRPGSRGVATAQFGPGISRFRCSGAAPWTSPSLTTSSSSSAQMAAPILPTFSATRSGKMTSTSPSSTRKSPQTLKSTRSAGLPTHRPPLSPRADRFPSSSFFQPHLRYPLVRFSRRTRGTCSTTRSR